MENGKWKMGGNTSLSIFNFQFSIQRIREFLAIALVAALPFHALFVTVATKIIAGPGHAPLTVIALWKEGLLMLILVIAVIEILLHVMRSFVETKNFASLQAFDLLDFCILLALANAVILFIFHFPFSIFHFLLGFKYDFLPLVAFLILRRVDWSEWFFGVAPKTLLVVGCIVAVYGLVTLFLPSQWFTALGYSDLHSLYVPGGPLAVFQHIGGTAIRRIQSTMSGPNQLGLWLLIPLAMGIALSFERRALSAKKYTLLIAQSVQLTALFLTFSRAAWIAAALMPLFALFRSSHPKIRGIGRSLVLIGIPCVIILAFIFPSLIVRFESSSDHFRRPAEALESIAANPLGLGLGSAGPASNRFSDTCVDLPPGADASWAESRPDLCVFIAGKQMLPMNRECHCPLLTENWYLQWGVEMGVVGLVLSFMLVILVLQKLRALSFELRVTHSNIAHSSQLTAHSCFLMYLGLSVAGLFLHAFEDSAVAYTVWVLLGATLTLRPTSADAIFRR